MRTGLPRSIWKWRQCCACRCTASHFEARSITCERINKAAQGRPHIVDHIINGDIAMIINTTASKKAIADNYSIRREALMHKVFYQTTIAGGHAVALARAPQVGKISCGRYRKSVPEMASAKPAG